MSQDQVTVIRVEIPIRPFGRLPHWEAGDAQRQLREDVTKCTANRRWTPEVTREARALILDRLGELLDAGVFPVHEPDQIAVAVVERPRRSGE